MTIEILDPTHEEAAVGFEKAARLTSLEGKTVAIVSNGKRSTKPFFDALEKELTEQFKVGNVVRLTKANYSAPVEPALLEEAEKWHALIAGIGD